MRFQSWFLKTSFWHGVRRIRKRPGPFLISLVLDFVFLGILVGAGTYVAGLVPSDPDALLTFFGGRNNLLIFSIVYPLVYYAFIVLVYSGIKGCVLSLLGKIYDSKLNIFDCFWKFYLLNLSIFFIFLSAGLVVTLLLGLVLQGTYVKVAFIVFIIPFLLAFYAMLHICHTLFVTGKAAGLLKSGFGILFTRIRDYGGFVVWDAFLLVFFYVLSNLIHFALRPIVTNLLQSVVGVDKIYFNFFNIITLIFMYSIVAFNRVYFFERQEHHVFS